MSSIIRSSLVTVVSPHRYSVILFWGLLVLVSSFSGVLPPCGSNQSYQRGLSSLHLISHPYEQRQQNGNFQPTSRSPLVLSMASEVTTTGDSQEVRDLFSKYCDKDKLIDRKTLESISPIADMLADEDILPSELDEIWKAAPKSSDDSSRVAYFSFVKIYSDVDDLFEDDEEEDDEESQESDDKSNEDSTTETPSAGINYNELDEELFKAYKSISDDNGLVSKDKMKEWEEIESLQEEGLLGEDEFEELWKNAVNNENGMLGASGFFAFNVGLDELFVLEDDEDDEIDDDGPEELSPNATPPRAMVVEGDSPPGVLFSQLADKNYLVGMEELNLWAELKDLLEDGDLPESELQDIYDKFATQESSGKLNEESFLQLYDAVDALFEDVDDEDDTEEVVAPAPPQKRGPPINKRVKEDLIAFIDIVVEEDEDPCGFGASESDQGQILNIVQVLEQQPTNLILQKEGNIELADLKGNWELLYTTSGSMKFNNGLSGIGRSFPNGKFAGVRQELKSTKLYSDMEYKERIEVNPSNASFDVTVNGSWDLRKSISLFTGQPTVILNVEPDRVSYGLTSTRADHWKTLGPVNRLDLSYLDDDFRVMRGCTSSDTLFIFKKIN